MSAHLQGSSLINGCKMARTSSYNVKGIALKAGVSTATVSRVINNHPGVNEVIRGKILKLLKEESSGNARSGKPVKVLTVVEIDKPIVEGFLSGVLASIAQYTLEHPIEIELCFLPRELKNVNLLKMLRDKRCEAVIGIFLSERSLQQVNLLSEQEIPVMLVGEKAESPLVGHVLVDSHQGAICAVDYLASLGHKCVGFLANDITRSQALRLRLEGYKASVIKNGLQQDERLIVHHHPTRNTYEAGYLQTKELLAAVPEVTALFASTDEMAYGAMRACRDLNRTVPGSISIIGFDDYPGSSYSIPALTTVSSSLSDVGFEAVKYLDQYVNGLSSSLPKIELEGVLIKRESCQAWAPSITAPSSCLP